MNIEKLYTIELDETISIYIIFRPINCLGSICLYSENNNRMHIFNDDDYKSKETEIKNHISDLGYEINDRLFY